MASTGTFSEMKNVVTKEQMSKFATPRTPTEFKVLTARVVEVPVVSLHLQGVKKQISFFHVRKRIKMDFNCKR
jgi:hypothetical protein